MECPNIPECAFYHDRLEEMPPTAEFMKMVFCHQKAEHCLRRKGPAALDDERNPASPLNPSEKAQTL